MNTNERETEDRSTADETQIYADGERELVIGRMATGVKEWT